jgi:SAM-dependent methyltransferase
MSLASTVREKAFDTGARTLEIFEGTDRINRRIYDCFASDLGERVIEVGSGIGNVTQFLCGRQCVVATDVEHEHLGRLRERFAGHDEVHVERLDLDAPDPALSRFRPDSIIAVNVLEHVEDDRRALRWMHDLVGARGRICIYVPALQSLFGTVDEALGHHRRYEQVELLTKVREAGFDVSWCRWLNVLGIPGWYLSGKILRRRLLSASQLRLYDRLVPWLKWEDALPLRFGMNLALTAVAR